MFSYRFIALGLIGQAKAEIRLRSGAGVRAFGRTARTRNSCRKLSKFAPACAAGRRLGRRRLGRGPLVGRGVDRAEARCPILELTGLGSRPSQYG